MPRLASKPETLIPTEQLRFRQAAETDIEQLLELVQAGYRGRESRKGWTTEADLLDGQRTDRDELKAQIDAANSLILLGELGADLVGCCRLERHLDASYFGLFTVRPRQQGQGLGGTILREAERLAIQRWGCRAMHLHVIAQRDELIAWYERRGYARTGESVPFPYGDSRAGLPKRSDLSFVVLAKDLR